VKEALQVGDPSAQLQHGRVAREQSSLAAASKEKARELRAEAAAAQEEAEEERSLRGPVNRMVEILEATGRPKESDDPEAAWQEVQAEMEGEQEKQPSLVFGFQAELGWDAVGTAEMAPAVEPVDDDSSEVLEEVSEYFPPIQMPSRPVVRVSSLVAGAFRCGTDVMVAHEVACSSLGSCGMSWSQVQPDGSFCLFAAANVPFELWVYIVGDAVPFRFGPFLAKSVDEVTYVGLLEPELACTAGEWRQHVPCAAGHISLPRLEPACIADLERCTCDASQLQEFSEELPSPSASVIPASAGP